MTPPHVLVVDDQLGMRETVVELLEQVGHTAVGVASGEAALEALARESFDVVVMDIRMPGMDGVTVLEEIGSPPPRVILMTGYALEERLHAAIRAGAFAILEKPFSAPYLLDLVDQAGAAV